MIIVILKETSPYENRVSATPQTVKKFVSQGFDVLIEKQAGECSYFDDSEYVSAKAKIKSTSVDILRLSDILLKIQPPTTTELKYIKNSSIIICNFQNHISNELLRSIKSKSLTCFALEKIPRISKTQPFDILSSQDNLSGYQAVIKSAQFLTKSIPMMITSAGTVTALKFLILGIGVAGLQAIATAKRLGAKVYAHDIRPETKEQAQSLGAIFLSDISDIIKDIDVIIASAFSIGKKAPVLIKSKDIKKMKKGSILIDMAVAFGGNIEGSQNFKLINITNRQVYANSTLANEIPQTASQLYANNLSNFIDYLQINPKKTLQLNNSDEIIQSVLIKGY